MSPADRSALSADPRSSPAESADLNGKAYATLRAHAALNGFTCGCTAEGWIVIRRFGMSAVFDTIADASNWIHHRTGFAS